MVANAQFDIRLETIWKPVVRAGADFAGIELVQLLYQPVYHALMNVDVESTVLLAVLLVETHPDVFIADPALMILDSLIRCEYRT